MASSFETGVQKNPSLPPQRPDLESSNSKFGLLVDDVVDISPDTFLSLVSRKVSEQGIWPCYFLALVLHWVPNSGCRKVFTLNPRSYLSRLFLLSISFNACARASFPDSTEMLGGIPVVSMNP